MDPVRGFWQLQDLRSSFFVSSTFGEYPTGPGTFLCFFLHYIKQFLMRIFTHCMLAQYHDGLLNI